MNGNNELENKVEYLEEYIETVLSCIPISILLVNSNFKVVFANRNYLYKTKRSSADVIGADIRHLFPSTFSGAMDLESKISKVIQKNVTKTGKVSYRYTTYNYQVIPARAEKKDEKRVLLVLDDVTEEMDLEERIRQIERHLTDVVQSASDIVFSADPKGRILTWNAAAERISGYEASEVEKKLFVSLFSDEDKEKIRARFSELKKGVSIPSCEFNLVTKDGKSAPIAWGFGAIRNDNGEVVGFMGMGRDLTERKEMETRLIQTEKLASLGRLAAGVAHEINNPLGVISTSADNLLRIEDNDQFKQRNIKRIKVQVENAAKIVEDLLNYSKPTRLNIVPLRIEKVLEKTLSLVEHQLKLDNIETIREFAPDLPEIKGDSLQLQQVFMNMIQNSHQAMPEGGKLYIVTKPAENNEPFVQVIFSDTGKGIPPADLPHIFDPFYTTREIGGGTGLGLSVSYSIVQKHNGSFDVKSEVGKGTAFFIKLPMCR